MRSSPVRARVATSSLCLAALLVAACTKTETTSIVVEVYTESLKAGVDVDALVASVNHGDPATFKLASPAGAGTTDFPVRFSVTPSESDADVVTVEVVGRLGGADKITTGAKLGFVKGETRFLRLRLDRECLGFSPACASGLVCVAGQCASNAVDVTKLPKYVAPVGDGGPGKTDATADGGGDVSVDEAPASDASTTDAASGADATSPVDTGASDAASCAEGATRECSCGQMAGGHQSCSGNKWSACAISCDATGMKGTCGPGTRVCDEAQAHWGACSIAPTAADTCAPDDDDNCNGIKNEGCTCVMGQTQTCDKAGLFGACAKGTQTCDLAGKWSACSIKPAAADTCDPGNDDTCNGVVNEKCPCINGKTRPCTDGGLFGKCATGTQTCVAQAWGACSIAPAAADTCAANNDDNCNGKPNEGCACAQGQTRTCAQGGLFGKCATGTQTCDGTGKWGACSIAPAAADTCAADNDDNCNGRVNEGCSCVVGQTRACSDGGAKGNCAAGTQKCDGTGKWGACSIAAAASDTCATGDDSTCNGVPNEGCGCLNGQTRLCSAGGAVGKCAGGMQTCAGGAWGACSISPSANDTCAAGNDDNCNGTPNQGCACLNGTTRLCSAGGLFGKCANGNQTCSAGAWGACSITPSGADTCASGNDDNCNGMVNEGCACTNGMTRSCSAGGFQGKCAGGTQTCSGGSWGGCSITASASDTCDAGNDDNCNGIANQGCSCLNGQTRTCAAGGLVGKCAGGMQTCAGGTWGACSIPPSANDTCVSGNDDNCNGVANQGCACLAGATKCATSPERRQTCDSAGVWQTVENCANTSAICQNGGTACLKPDGVTCTSGSQCVSGICGTFYNDADGDGYGDANASIRLCGTGGAPGYITDSSDCCDSDAAAYPGQTAYSDLPRMGCGGYDYNCDGAETKLLTQLASMSCDLTFHSCTFYSAGWAGSVPGCGLRVNWLTGCTYYAGGPTPSCAVSVQIFPSQPIQTCR